MGVRRLVFIARRNSKTALLAALVVVALILGGLRHFYLHTGSYRSINYSEETATPTSKLRVAVPQTRKTAVVNVKDLNENITALGQRSFASVALAHQQQRIPSNDIKCLPVILPQLESKYINPTGSPATGMKYDICKPDLKSIFFGHLHSLALAVDRNLEAVWMPRVGGLSENLFNLTLLGTKLKKSHGIQLHLYDPPPSEDAVDIGTNILLGRGGNFTPPEGIFNIGCTGHSELLSSRRSNLNNIERIYTLLIQPSISIQKVVDQLAAELDVFDVLYYNETLTAEDIQSYELAVNVQFPTRYRRPMMFVTAGNNEPKIKFQNFNALSARYLCEINMDPIIKQWVVLQLSRTTRRFFGDEMCPYSKLVSQVRLASNFTDRGSNYLIKRRNSASQIVACCSEGWCLSNFCSTVLRKRVNESLVNLKKKLKNAKKPP
eukprot:TRINITY_DN34214_c0_g1_i1.p1 TRINITY_DN34214_c0_g1~~TRINITY_DN34214_c0_g1_i1.p1  ORF type:complete len:442 (+),score=47.33 TRINITY_DN34214_c0_g1_i1:23-1327(+)